MKNSSPLLLQDEKETLHENIRPFTTTTLLASYHFSQAHKNNFLIDCFAKNTKTNITHMICTLEHYEFVTSTWD
jgi:hypothetical protein